MGKIRMAIKREEKESKGKNNTSIFSLH